MIGGQHCVQPVLIRGHESAHAADGLKTQHHRQHAAYQQRRALEQIGPRHRLQSSPRRIQSRDRANDPDRRDEVRAENRLKRQRAGIDHRRDADPDVDHHQVEGHDAACGGIVPVLEELGHRVDSAPQQPRENEERHYDQRDRGDPLIAGDGQPHCSGALPGLPDNLLGGYVRRNQRQAN